ncbi:MAG: hypothetical protein EP329_09810 [Deltaproteobacteria bacterium]|nr:MAG: hypothetical protein EP329_09810 [Deltaproteobacteria bacterium]
MLARRVMIGMVLGAMAVIGTAAPAFADDCAGSSLKMVRSEDAAYRVDIRTVAREGWEARFVPVHEPDGAYTRLAEVPGHAHLIVAVPGKSTRFVVIRAGAERETTSRVLVYEAVWNPLKKGPPGPEVKLVKAFDLKDLLTEAELAQVRASISHLHWLFPRTDGKPPVRLTGDDRVEVQVIGGRAVELALDHLELVKTPSAPKP